jgi:hypothetical protein
MMPFVPAIAAPRIELFEQCGWRDTRSGKVCLAGKNTFRHKKDPGQFTLPGLLQVVASACRLL